MEAFPAFFPLAGRRVVIVGSGEAAEAKARLFAGSPAVVERIDGDQARSAEAYRGAALAFVAGEDDGFVTACVAAARAAGVPVNAPDRPALCDFTTPAIVDRGPVVAAVGTGGAAPMLATMLRHRLEAQLPESLGEVARLFGALQDEIRKALPEAHRRRAFLRSVLSEAVGDEAALRAALTAARSGAPAGGVITLDGRGPAEALTLGQVRALAAADVLVVDVGVDPAVLDLARRDAPRLAPPQDLETLAAEGIVVVWLTVSPTPP